MSPSNQPPADGEPPIEARLVESPTERPPIEYASPPVWTDPRSGSQSNTGGRFEFLENKWAILAILFSVTGFLGIPLLWENQKFSPRERIVWSIVVTLYTLALIAVATAICYWSYRQVFA